MTHQFVGRGSWAQPCSTATTTALLQNIHQPNIDQSISMYLRTSSFHNSLTSPCAPSLETGALVEKLCDGTPALQFSPTGLAVFSRTSPSLFRSVNPAAFHTD